MKLRLRQGFSPIKTIILGFCFTLGIGSCRMELPSSPERSPEAISQTVIKLGVLLPLTGEAAAYGIRGRKAIELAVSEMNQSHPTADPSKPARVVAIFEDSRAEPKTGVSAMQKLVEVDRVPAVIGDLVSSVTLAAAPIAQRNRVILLSPTASTPAISEAGDYIYRIWPSDLAEGKAIAQLAVQRGYQKIAILYLNNDYGRAIADVFKAQFAAQNRSITLMEGYAAPTNDFRSVLTKIGQDPPNAIYVAGYFADTAKILKQARELGIEAQFLGTTAVEDSQFLNLAGSTAEGIIYPLATGFDPESPQPITQAFLSRFKQKYGTEPGWVEAHAYDAFRLIYGSASALPNQVDGAGIKARLDRDIAFPGVTGEIKFDRQGDVTKPPILKTVKAGKFQRLAG